MFQLSSISVVDSQSAAKQARSKMFADRTNWNLDPNRLSEALAHHRSAGKPLFDLTLSNPTSCGFAYDGDAILRALNNPAALHYEPNPRGLEHARRAVAAYYASRNTGVSPSDIILTTGTSEAYSYIFRPLCNPSHQLLIPAPGYPLFGFLADTPDVRPVRHPPISDTAGPIAFPSPQHAIPPRPR